jgi:tetratricopeptide (TPR) repeat protein
MMTTTSIPDLRQQPFFASLPRHEWVYLQSRLVRHDLEPGSLIVQQGERGDFYAILSRGRVALESSPGNLETLERGGVLGEAMLRYGVPSPVTARALTPCSIWVLQRADWLAARDMVHTPLEESVPQAAVAPLIKTVFARHRLLLGSLALCLLVILYLGPSLLRLANRNIVNMAMHAGHPDLAASYLRFALFWQPDSAALHDALGYAFYLDGDYTQAREQFRQALNLDAEMATAQNNMGVTLLAQGRAREAISYLVSATLLAPGNADTYYNLGNAYMAAGVPQAAASAYQRAFTLDPTQLQARAHWAGILLGEGKMSEARQTWQAVLAANPNQALAHRGLGALAVLESRPAAALSDLSIALQSDPEDAEAQFYLGLAMEALGRPEEAYDAFEKALALSQNPDLQSLAQEHMQNLQQQFAPGGLFQKGGASKAVP